MTPSPSPSPRRSARHAASEPADEPAADAPAAAAEWTAQDRAGASACRVPGCDADPEWRGLCAAHRQTHRGLVGPKETKR